MLYHINVLTIPKIREALSYNYWYEAIFFRTKYRTVIKYNSIYQEYKIFPGNSGEIYDL